MFVCVYGGGGVCKVKVGEVLAMLKAGAQEGLRLF